MPLRQPQRCLLQVVVLLLLWRGTLVVADRVGADKGRAAVDGTAAKLSVGANGAPAVVAPAATNSSDLCVKWLVRNRRVQIDRSFTIAEDCTNYRPCQLVVRSIESKNVSFANVSSGGTAAAANDRTTTKASQTELPTGVVLRVPSDLVLSATHPPLASAAVERLLSDATLQADSVSDVSLVVLRLFLLVNERRDRADEPSSTRSGPVRLKDLDVHGVSDWLSLAHHGFHDFVPAFYEAGVDGEVLEVRCWAWNGVG